MIDDTLISMSPQGENQTDMIGAAVQIIDVTTMDFEQKVMAASMNTPVIVDFWAPWCGPCKQLMPVLEKCVQAAAGKVILAKVNIDENPELAQAMQVQSVPTVLAFSGGQPVDGFMGVQPESQITAFVDKLVQMAGGEDPAAQAAAEQMDAFLAQADQVLEDGDWQAAQAGYMQVLQVDPENETAVAGLIRTRIVSGQIDDAKELLKRFQSQMTPLPPKIKALEKMIDLLDDAPAGTSAEMKTPKTPEAHFDMAMLLFKEQAYAAAIDTLLAIVQKDKEWEEGKARIRIIEIFDALGKAHAVTIEGRKKLSAILFS